MVDADHFKRYNDRYGHAVGDEVLAGLAEHLAASMPRSKDFVFRVGGEEFVLLLPNTNAASALRVAGRVHLEVAKLAIGPADIGAGSVTVSIGGATAMPDAAQASTDLYRRADAALYEAKARGRNQTCCVPEDAPGPHPQAAYRLVGVS